MSHRSAKPRPAAPPKGAYANYFEVGHTAFEFVIDFGQTYAGKEPSACHTRIVTSPVYAQALLRILQDAVVQFETRFGSAGELSGR